MNVPKIKTTEGIKPIIILPNKLLVEGFLTMAVDAKLEDVDLVRLLEYAEPNPEKNGEILRRCLEGKVKLIPVYWGFDEKEPKGAKPIGSIMDGFLFLVQK